MVVAKTRPKLKKWQEGPNDPALQPLTPEESNGLHRDEHGVTHMPEGRSGMGVAYSATTGSGHLEAVQVSLETFAAGVSGPASMPVTDRTTLTGKYSFTIEFKSSGLAADPNDNADASEPTADVFTVLRQQLGLVLERKETPRNILVIDRIQRLPTEN
jgi:uncharacterized protein (TIGR03435 family)